MTLALATENYLGGKLEIHSGMLISNKKGELGKKEMCIEDVKTIIQKKAKLIQEKANLIMFG